MFSTQDDGRYGRPRGLGGRSDDETSDDIHRDTGNDLIFGKCHSVIRNGLEKCYFNLINGREKCYQEIISPIIFSHLYKTQTKEVKLSNFTEGENLRSQSLKTFVRKCHLPLAVRSALTDYRRETLSPDSPQLLNLPLYALCRLKDELRKSFQI